MIRSLGKLLSVPASQPPAVSNARECNLCDNIALIHTQKLPISASVSCNCKAFEGYEPPESQSLFKVYENEGYPLDDWEFAGDEEKGDEEEDVEASLETSRYLTGANSVPNLLQLSLPLLAEASPSITVDDYDTSSSLDTRTATAGLRDEELGQSRACDWLEPPPPSGAAAMQERQRQVGDEGVMLEAFQQFQHDPQIQKMVVALATDAGVWRAVLANKKLQDYRISNEKGDFDTVAPQSRMVSNFVLISHNAVRELKEGLRDQIRGVFVLVDRRLEAETRQMMYNLMLRTFAMMAFFMLTLIAFLCLLPLQVSQGD